MEFFTRYLKQLEYYFFLILLAFILQGCGREESISRNDMPPVMEEESFEDAAEEKAWEPCYEITEDDLLQWEQVRETETEDYYIVEHQDEEGTYPQIILKEGKEIFCGTEHLNYLFSWWSWWDYNILYADSHYISLWLGYADEEAETIDRMCLLNINLQCPVAEYFVNGAEDLIYIQDDNDYKYAQWPSNGITLSLEDVLEEVERGNCYLDETAYAIWKESPETFIESIRRQFEEIKEGGYGEAYNARYSEKESMKAYRMYLREGRVGFYIHPLDYWEKNENIEKKEEDPDDFRIEVAYDWQETAPVYHMTYEVYGQPYEGQLYGESFQGHAFRTFYYPQVRGLKEEIQAILNENMEKDFKNNLELMTLDKWNERLKQYGYAWEWDELPPVNNPMVTYQSERYLCIRQDIIMNEDNALRYAEGWKRYHVYDLETGESLKLEDIILLDENFIGWLKEEKKVEARTRWYEGMWGFDEMVVSMKEDLEDYPEELLYSVLEDAEFWMKEGSLYIRIPSYDQQYRVIQYSISGTGAPSYIDYNEVRIAVEDIEEFLKVEPW